MIHTVKGIGIVNKAEVDVFLELSCFFDDPEDVGNLISGSSAFCKTSLNIWKFTVHVPLKPGLENFDYYFASVWHECNCAVVWAFFGIAFLWDWNENWPFPVLWPLLSFPNLLVRFIRLSTMARLSWVTPPGMAHSFIELDKAAWVILWQKVLFRDIGLRSYDQPEEFRKVQKKTPHFLSPPRILFGFHLGWVMHASPGRTLSQSNWPETTWKPIPSPQNLRLQAT